MQIIQSIQNRIYTIRGQRVLLDSDLAQLYEVETKVLNQAVKRNLERFPEDFMFQLTNEELSIIRPQNVDNHVDRLRSQFVTLKNNRGLHIKYLPYVFTEQGVAMLSSVLRSDKAVQMNIAIMRAFVEMRKLALQPFDIAMHLQQIFKRLEEHDIQLATVFETLENLMDEKAAQRKWDNRDRIRFKKTS
jgi:hypothetical protein